MAEYVDREKLIEGIKNDCCELVYYTKIDVIDCVKAAKAEDVVPVVHGRWVKIYEDTETITEARQVAVCCNKCMGIPEDKFTESDYCPHCGA